MEPFAGNASHCDGREAVPDSDSAQNFQAKGTAQSRIGFNDQLSDYETGDESAIEV